MVIPDNFESWRACIEVHCGIPLTKDFIYRRIAVYRDESLDETKRFVARYGQQHHQNVLLWLQQALIYVE